ncbi:MAG: nucleotide-binding protein [Cytophagales bacterium]|nr:nucleotide-binding protein [Cytophagales bacterium]
MVDTNIVFSAMWNTNGRIAHILSRKSTLSFYSPTYLLLEIANHKEKLSKKIILDSVQFLELQHIATRRITFVDEGQISYANWIKAERLTSEVDSDDIAFVALALELKCPLWTGDKRLSNAITEIQIYQTSQLDELLNG